MWVGPDDATPLREAVERAGGLVVSEPAEANAIVWSQEGYRPEGIVDLLHEGVEWVQLESAGVDGWLARGLIDRERTWTGAQGVYAADVAEHILAFVLAAARRLGEAARRRTWGPLGGDRVAGKTVGIVGAGAIGRETIARFRPLGVRVLALTRSGRAVEGAARSLSRDALDELLRESDYVVLAAPLTDETRGLIGERELGLIGPAGWLVNVGRGRLVDTDALVRALQEGRVRAALDVTDPEPLPPDHPLATAPGALVVPHIGSATHTARGRMTELAVENLEAGLAGRPLPHPAT